MCGLQEHEVVDLNERAEEEKIETEEVMEAIRAIKNGKSAGHDKITPAMIKSMLAKTTEKLTKLYNKAFQEGESPDDSQFRVIVPIHKKGDSSRCENYRGITSISIVVKVYEQITKLGDMERTTNETRNEDKY